MRCRETKYNDRQARDADGDRSDVAVDALLLTQALPVLFGESDTDVGELVVHTELQSCEMPKHPA